MSLWTKWFINFISAIFWYMPKSVKWAVASFFGWFVFDVIKFRRFIILRNITIAFPNWSKEKRYEVVRKNMKLLMYHFPELMTIPNMSKQWVEENVPFHGLEHYEEALKKQKGVLLLSCHLGNGDMAITALTLKGVKAHLISKKFSIKFLNDFWFGIREAHGAKFIDPHGAKTAFDILGACRKNEAVIFVIDQFMSKPYGIPTTFFGRNTGTAYGLALFAIKTGAPVVPVYSYRDENLNTHMAFGPEVPLVDIKDRDLQIKTMTQKYNEVIEDLIRQHPDQWMWVHRRWKQWG